MRASFAEVKVNPVKTPLVLLAACGLILASQRPAQAQVSWGIPLPFPFLFYNFNQGYAQPYYGGQRAYYGYRRYYPPRYYYAPAWRQSYFGPSWGGYGGW